MKKIVRPGTILIGRQRASIFCKIEFEEGKLSISGVEGPLPSGNARGSCGQIDMHLRDDLASIKPAPLWTEAMIERFFDVWHKWHLNAMMAGSPAQHAHLSTVEDNSYSSAVKALTEAGLQPDTSYLHNGKPYSYGSAWLRKEVPDDVIAFLESLPETDIKPAWV